MSVAFAASGNFVGIELRFTFFHLINFTIKMMNISELFYTNNINFRCLSLLYFQ